MQHKKIERLTPEQEALFPTYLEKWRAIAPSNFPLIANIAFMLKQNLPFTLLMATVCTPIMA
jgi:hypothetical protein